MPLDRSTELFFLRQFLMPDYAQLAILIGLLLVAIYRPERIYLPGMFRLSCVLLAVSIVVSPIASAILNTMMTTTTSRTGAFGSNNHSELALLYSLVQVFQPILVALSFCFGLFALLPSPRRPNRQGPRQHPLDS